MKRLARAALFSLVMAATAVSVVRAGESWCDVDPPVRIQTPAGSNVMVHATNGALGEEHIDAVRDAEISYTATAAAGGTATDVVVSVLIRGDAWSSDFPTRSTVSTHPFGGGTVYASTTGTAGTVMRLSFRLDVP